MGKKTPLYSGGNNPTVTPQNSLAEGGTTAEGSTTALTQRYCRAGEEVRDPAPERYYRGSRRGTIAWGTTTVLRPKTTSGTTAWGAVLPLWERYYRLSASAVLPLWTAVLPLAPSLSHYRENKEYSKETRTAITSANELRIEQTQACVKQDNE